MTISSVTQNAHAQYKAAQAAFARGDFEEAIKLCALGLENIRRADPAEDALHLQIIRLLLTASEIQWRGQVMLLNGKLQVMQLYEEAEAIALRTSNKTLLALLAQIKLTKSVLLVATHSVPEAIEVMREALDLAQSSGDVLTQYITMAGLGHHVVKIDLEQGLRLISQAQEQYAQHMETAQNYLSPDVIYRQSHVEVMAGIGEFDRGNYDSALALLTQSRNRYKQQDIHSGLPSTLNYLAQLYLASGLFEQAEATLKEAIALFDRAHNANPWNGNNLALLGKLYVEWERLDDAGEPLRRGWQETQATYNLDLISLVRNYYAEYLMHPHARERDLGAAAQYLQLNLEETRAVGIHRSAIMALSLLGQLSLMQHHIDRALSYSIEAVEYLEKIGTMPALRTQEIFFNHSNVLKAANQSEEARRYLEKAYQVVQGIARSITDENRRQSFLKRVQLNRAIEAHYTGYSA